MRITTTTAALAAAALAVLVAAPAHAERYGVDDPQDTWHGSDIRDLSVHNGQEDLVITTTHDNLVRRASSGSALTIYLDTDRDHRGPEYVFAAGLFDGTDYLLSETDGFGPKKWGDAVENGDYILHIGYRKDRARVKIDQATIGSPDAVRVAVRASGTRTDGTSHGLVDWVGKPRQFSPWIDRG
ncbi:hypothetical protein [Nocardioides aquiterrae]|uniref:Uncharacterized protein n=1 Tax=Nocardioides aquiterrae TaxID=203799 RepID=A0ABN1UJ11_9ACTN